VQHCCVQLLPLSLAACEAKSDKWMGLRKYHGNSEDGIKIAVFLRDGDKCNCNTAGMGTYVVIITQE